MSKRYLKYETEHENPLVDENGVLKSDNTSADDKVSDLFLYISASDGTVLELSLDGGPISFTYKHDAYCVGEETINELINLITNNKLRLRYRLTNGTTYYSSHFSVSSGASISNLVWVSNNGVIATSFGI